MYFLIMITKLPQLRSTEPYAEERVLPVSLPFHLFLQETFSCFFFPVTSGERFVLSKRRGLFVRIRAIFLLHSCWNPGACLWPAETTQRVTASDDSCPEERKQVVAAFRSRKRKKI